MLQEKERKEIEDLRGQYEEKKTTDMDVLRKKNKKVKLPAEIFAWTFGILGALVMGVGMCLAMRVIGDQFVLGIIIGILGIAMVCANYFIFRAILSSRKKKYAKEILELTSQLLNE